MLSHFPLFNSSNLRNKVANNCRTANNKMRFIQLTFFSLLINIVYSGPSAVISTPSIPNANVFLLPSNNSPLKSLCSQISSNNLKSDDDTLLLCQLYESSTLLTQLGALVNQGIERLLLNQDGLKNAVIGQMETPNWEADLIDAQRDKKKHEYLRFGKRKHEYLRFGKRKHEYLRFGKK